MEEHDAGYRHGRHYSTAVPEGEIGSTHVADEFRAARERGWRPNPRPKDRT